MKKKLSSNLGIGGGGGGGGADPSISNIWLGTTVMTETDSIYKKNN